MLVSPLNQREKVHNNFNYILFPSAILEEPLPEAFGPTIDQNAASEYIKNLMKQALPRSEHANLATELKWHFVLDKHSVKEPKQGGKIKKKFLTRKQRYELGLLKLPKTGWSYSKLETIREMWKGYMRENLDYTQKVPSFEDPEWPAFSTTIGKSEFVGCEIKVVRSRNNSCVNVSGTVVLETKECFHIVTPQSKLRSKFFVVIFNMFILQ